MARKTGVTGADFIIAPYSKKYLYGKFENGVQIETRMRYVKLFALLALVSVCIACVNFMNLTTAQASRRMKEIGIKKIAGASRKTLIFHYMSESVLMSIIALIAAVLMVNLLLPQFNQTTGKLLVFGFTTSNLAVYVAIAILIGIIAGSYPALYLSSFKPVLVLKRSLSSSFAELIARSGLVVFQFGISIIGIVGVLVIYQQLVYVQTTNLGYDKENLIYFELEGRIAEDHEAFLSEVQQMPGVINASAMVGNIVGTIGHEMQININNKAIQFHWLGVDYEMIETLGIPMRSGRTFSREFNDSARVIVNQAAIDAMAITDPIGKLIPFGNGQVEIIGVTKNFHLRSLHEAISPLAFRLEPDVFWNIFVRLEEGKQHKTLRDLEAVYKKFNPGFALDYRFVDQTYQSQYASESRVASLSVWFAGLAIVVSCLGLFGLASYSAERRIKEIGIRKVLGSTALGIVLLLCKDFMRLVLVAVIISIPISYYLLNEWLNSFAYAIDLQWWVFIMAGMISVVIALVTTGSQAVKASLINPSKCLRNE
jgi:ABC-type lipoprotein release transport system permease subunit